MRVDRYEMLERLGAGGSGEVYRARQTGARGFERIVAVKRLHPSRDRDVEALVEEARLLLPLQHGHIVSVLDLVASDDDSQLFLVLEFVDGASLETLLEAAPALEPALALTIARAVAEGMRYAHAQPGGPVLHLDLAPDNVLLSRDGAIKITDFGSGRRASVPGKTGLVQGKWPYMSPEQIEGSRLGPASDVWSLGVLVHQLATGNLPFDGADPVEVQEAVLSGRRAPAPPPFDGVVDAALARDPAARVREMGGLVEAIDRALAQAGGARAASDVAAWVSAHLDPKPVDPRAARALSALGLGGQMRRLTAAADSEDVISLAPVPTAVNASDDMTAVSPVPLAPEQDPTKPTDPGAPPPMRTETGATVPGALVESAPDLEPALEATHTDPARAADPGLAAQLASPAAPPEVATQSGVSLSPQAQLHRAPPPPAPPASVVTSAPQVMPASDHAAAPPAGGRKLAVAAVLVIAFAVGLGLSAQIPGVPETPSPSAPAAVPPPAPPSPSVVPRVPAARVPAAPPSAGPSRPAPRVSRRPAAAKASLRIFAEPWGYVFLDGKATGKATPATLEVAVGARRVRVENPHTGKAASTRVTLAAGEQRLVRLELK